MKCDGCGYHTPGQMCMICDLRGQLAEQARTIERLEKERDGWRVSCQTPSSDLRGGLADACTRIATLEARNERLLVLLGTKREQVDELEKDNNRLEVRIEHSKRLIEEQAHCDIDRQERIAILEKKLILIGERAVVDWDDGTVGEVDSVVKGPLRYRDWIREVFDGLKKVSTLEARNTKLDWWVEHLMNHIRQVAEDHQELRGELYSYWVDPASPTEEDIKRAKELAETGLFVPKEPGGEHD